METVDKAKEQLNEKRGFTQLEGLIAQTKSSAIWLINKDSKGGNINGYITY